MSALEMEDNIVESLILRLGDIAIKAGHSAVLFHQKLRKTKTESTPVSPRFAFYGEIESITHESLEDGQVILTIILKPKAAP